MYLKRSLSFATDSDRCSLTEHIFSRPSTLHGQGFWEFQRSNATSKKQAKKTADVARVHQNSGQQIPGLTKSSCISSRKGEQKHVESSTRDRLTTGRSSSKPWSGRLGSCRNLQRRILQNLSCCEGAMKITTGIACSTLVFGLGLSPSTSPLRHHPAPTESTAANPHLQAASWCCESGCIS